MSQQSSLNARRDVPVVPREYSGQWIAWNHDGTKILAASDDMTIAEATARQSGEQRSRLEKVPRADVRIVGGVRR